MSSETPELPNAVIALEPTSKPSQLIPTLPAAPSGDYELTLTAEQLDALIEKRFTGFLRTLTLPPERVARLRELFTERQRVTIDAANAALLFGLNPVHELPVIQEAIAKFEASVDAALQAEFGDALFLAWREFEEGFPERNLVNDLSGAMGSSEPVQLAQQTQLLEILKRFRPSTAPAPMKFTRTIYGPIDERATISDAAISAATSVLSPSQIAVLRAMQQAENSIEASQR